MMNNGSDETMEIMNMNEIMQIRSVLIENHEEIQEHAI